MPGRQLTIYFATFRWHEIDTFKLVNCLVINTSSSFEQFVLLESLNLVRFHRWKLQIVSIVGSFRFLNVFLKNFFWSLRDLLLSILTITRFVQCTSVTGVEFGKTNESFINSEAKWINKFIVLRNTPILSDVLKNTIWIKVFASHKNAWYCKNTVFVWWIVARNYGIG